MQKILVLLKGTVLIKKHGLSGSKLCYTLFLEKLLFLKVLLEIKLLIIVI